MQQDKDDVVIFSPGGEVNALASHLESSEIVADINVPGYEVM